MKKKMTALGLIILFAAIPICQVEAVQISTKDSEDDSLLVEFDAVSFDDTIIKESFKLSEKELIELENDLLSLIESNQFDKDADSIFDIVMDFFEEKFPYLYEIISTITTKIDTRLARSFVFSRGKGYKFNPLKRSSITIRKRPFTFWRYTGKDSDNAKTIIKYPFALKTRTIEGKQIGYMTNFTGLYIFIARKLPLQSSSFLVGKAEHVLGFQRLFKK